MSSKTKTKKAELFMMMTYLKRKRRQNRMNYKSRNRLNNKKENLKIEK